MPVMFSVWGFLTVTFIQRGLWLIRRSRIYDLLKCDHRAKERHTQDVQDEFAYRKQLITANPPKPIGRLAAFLLAISRMNQVEGRDPTIVTSSVRCGVIAEWLGLDLQSLNHDDGLLVRPGERPTERLCDVDVSNGVYARAGVNS